MAYRSHVQIAGSRATRESLCIAWGPTLWVRGTLSFCPPIISDVQPRDARELPHGLQPRTSRAWRAASDDDCSSPKNMKTKPPTALHPSHTMGTQ